ncbi:uncharacterized protein LOC108912738 [Anoplophora glabripennis]|uniref:uncharacterized protein LOC108912738 n=1 Tax=Anoplophora glabripennis TaxID=217634 RepID=UPI0008738F37|nr:uncharacterized protein LOC108912738 [Anoplophora glabripennis]
MSISAELAALLTTHEKRILHNTYTRADFSYHNIKQSLHNMWAKIYVLDGSVERTASIKRIHECLANLEKRVAENEQKKYLNYYARPAGLGSGVGKGLLIGN